MSSSTQGSPRCIQNVSSSSSASMLTQSARTARQGRNQFYFSNYPRARGFVNTPAPPPLSLAIPISSVPQQDLNAHKRWHQPSYLSLLCRTASIHSLPDSQADRHPPPSGSRFLPVPPPIPSLPFPSMSTPTLRPSRPRLSCPPAVSSAPPSLRSTGGSSTSTSM